MTQKTLIFILTDIKTANLITLLTLLAEYVEHVEYGVVDPVIGRFFVAVENCGE